MSKCVNDEDVNSVGGCWVSLCSSLVDKDVLFFFTSF